MVKTMYRKKATVTFPRLISLLSGFANPLACRPLTCDSVVVVFRESRYIVSPCRDFVDVPVLLSRSNLLLKMADTFQTI